MAPAAEGSHGILEPMSESEPIGPERRTKGRSILMGCGVTVVVVFLLGVGACVSFVIWMDRPGEMLDAERLLSPRTEGFVEWTLRLEDPGTKQAVDSAMAAIRKMQGEMGTRGGGPVLQWIQDMGRQRNEQQLREMFPVVLVWAEEPGAGEKTDHLFALNFRSGGNRLVFLDWILGYVFGRQPTKSVETYQGERIYRLGLDGPSVFLREGTVYVSNSDGAARATVDLLLTGSAEGSSKLGDALHRTAASPLRGALRNEHGEAATVLSVLGIWPEANEEAQRLMDAMRNVRIEGGFDSAQALTGEVAFECNPLCGPEVRALDGKVLLSTEAPAIASGESASITLRVVGIDDHGGKLSYRVEKSVEVLARRIEARFRLLERHGGRGAPAPPEAPPESP
jgi:hypothetical protein